MNTWIFDVDGVLTDPLKKKASLGILGALSEILEKDDILAFNTGRSLSWLKERILNEVIKRVKNPGQLKKIIAVCEMGNVVFSQTESFWEVYIDPDSHMPKDLVSEVKELVEKKYSNSMFFDPKDTMISVEIIDGFSHREYLEEQKKFLSDLEKITKRPHFKNLSIRTGANQIAVDIQFTNAGKSLGAQKIQSWLKKNIFVPDKMFLFGDNKSDIEMAESLKHEAPLTFIFVNNPHELGTIPRDFQVVFTKDLYDTGTLGFLSEHL